MGKREKEHTKSNNKKSKRIIIFLIIIASMLIISLLAPYIVPNDPYQTNSAYLRVKPSMQFPFGTDKLGRCVFSRVLMGAKTSIFASLVLVTITMVVGTLLGIISGYYGKVIDQIVMRIADILLAFPQMVLAIAVAGILGGSMLNAMLALGISGWTLYARLARSKVLALKNEPFIQAAKLSGNSDFKIMTTHILPNIIGEIIVNASIQIGSTMLGFAGLSYLGLGVQIPKAEWGSMINEGRAYIQQAPWTVLAPGIALFLTVIIFNLFGDMLSDYFGIKETQDE